MVITVWLNPNPNFKILIIIYILGKLLKDKLLYIDIV